jgi:ketosteroid isomerase-like protein
VATDPLPVRFRIMPMAAEQSSTIRSRRSTHLSAVRWSYLSTLRFAESLVATVLFGLIIVLAITVILFMAPLAISAAPPAAKAAAGPTRESALATVEELGRAMGENDADGIAPLLSDDWAVISARGEVAEGKSVFPDGIKSGYLSRNKFELSEPRARLYGDMAVVTSKLRVAGTFGGKPFDVRERETDVMHWQDGAWKIVLTHETFQGPSAGGPADAGARR